MRLLRTHGLNNDQLHLVARATTVGSIMYAIPTWRGFASKDLHVLFLTDEATPRKAPGDICHICPMTSPALAPWPMRPIESFISFKEKVTQDMYPVRSGVTRPTSETP